MQVIKDLFFENVLVFSSKFVAWVLCENPGAAEDPDSHVEHGYKCDGLISNEELQEDQDNLKGVVV